jgi:hypothetical protein
MKLAIVWFTCSRDAEMLEKSYHSIIKQDLPLDLTFHVVASEADDFRIPSWATSFERTVSESDPDYPMAGKDIVIEMLSTMQEIAESFDSDYVLKIDSDTAMLGAAWLGELRKGWALLGGARDFGYQTGVWGAAYFLSGEALSQIDDWEEAIDRANGLSGGILGQAWQTESTKCPPWREDEVVSAVFAAYFPDGCRKVHDLYVMRYEFNASKDWIDYDFVEFGLRERHLSTKWIGGRLSAASISLGAADMGRCIEQERRYLK